VDAPLRRGEPLADIVKLGPRAAGRDRGRLEWEQVIKELADPERASGFGWAAAGQVCNVREGRVLPSEMEQAKKLGPS